MIRSAKRYGQFVFIAVLVGLLGLTTWHSLHLPTAAENRAFAEGVFAAAGIIFCFWMAVRLGAAARIDEEGE